MVAIRTFVVKPLTQEETESSRATSYTHCFIGPLGNETLYESVSDGIIVAAPLALLFPMRSISYD